MPVNRFIHFTDWVIGHSHLAMIGLQVSSRLAVPLISGNASLEHEQRARDELVVLAPGSGPDADDR